jgi:two-component system sensor histidine kinase SenX3
VETTVAAGLAGVLGLLVGALAVLAFRVSERDHAAGPPPAEPVVPADAAAVLAVLGSSTVVLDASDAVVRASPSAYAFGLVRDDRLVHDELRRLAGRVRRDGEIREAEMELRRGPVGEEMVSVAARVAPLGADLVLVIVEDRTEARRVDAIRRDFVANVSHELKTPVGALSLLAEAVAGASDDPEAVRRFAGRMQHEARRLSDLVQELIDLSRLQSADPLLGAQLVDLEEVVADAVDRCRHQAQDREIDLIAGGTPGLAVHGDRTQLVTALRNLIENAISYSPERTRVAIGVRRAGELVELTVTDQGIGIPESDLVRIFERFYRVDPARSRATGGTGLGLSIVKHIAANHGGEVSVWSLEGSGSTFTIRLPIGAEAPIGPSLLARPSTLREATP